MAKIIIYITSQNGDGFVNSMEFDSLSDVMLYSDNIGKSCLITIEEKDG